MKTLLKIKNLVALLLTIQFGFIAGVLAQQSLSTELTDPIHGKLMLVGTGEMSTRVIATFAYLAKQEEGNLVILSKAAGRDINIASQWKELIGTVSEIELGMTDNILSETDIATLQEATAVWLSDDFSKHHVGSQLTNELKELIHRDGVIGGQGTAAESMATFVKVGEELRDGFNLLPNSFILATKSGEDHFINTINSLPGRVGWQIPPKGAVVIHEGRQISVIGDPHITLRTPANGSWPERIDSYGPPIDDLPFTADLISWNRSATARLGEYFPPEVAPVPEVPNGALVIIGGNGYPDGMWARVIGFAGGKDANYVCFTQSANSTGARKLREHGCKNIAIHLVKTGVDGIGQGKDPQLLEDLKNADAVYFGGGRTYKFMDAFLDTEAHMLMKKVLERGGIILGGSAGAQIQGDFLVRGDPRTNNTLWMEGNDIGLGFIRSVIIDVHFRERGRENTLPSLLVKHPQMLGIGIDETTAIWVQGTTAEVLGPHSVTFYDLENVKDLNPSSVKIQNPVILMAGEKYDLKQRVQID
jgi:cyanophycinase